MTNLTVSIITPTYKGGDRLYGVYDSIKKQTYPIKEWIIVLDGDDDLTRAVANDISSESSIPVIIEVIAHNHKKAAVNRGVELASGEFSLIADDDDIFPPQSISMMIDAWNDIEESEQDGFVGVTGLCQDQFGEIVGDRFPSDRFVSNAIDCSLAKKISGEKWGMQKTSILKMYPYFEDAEGYVGESTVWMSIAKKYKTLYINSIVRVYLYNPNSIINSRHNSDKILKNCQAYVYGYKFTCENFAKEALSNPKFLTACSVNYARYLLHSLRFKKYKQWMSPFTSINAFLTFFGALPVGLYFFIKDMKD